MKFFEKPQVYLALQSLIYLLGASMLVIMATQFLGIMAEIGRTMEYNALMDQTSQYFR